MDSNRDDKTLHDRLDPKARGRETPRADYDRNRQGLYGGLPEVREDDTKDERPPRGN